MNDDFDKYLAIANHDIQMANNMGELKNYVASILYDNDKEVDQLQQKENIIKEVRECVEKYEVINGYYDSNYDGENDTYSHDLVKEDILEILDKVDKENI